jgi:DNA-binding PadR family transcriptional regulator
VGRNRTGVLEFAVLGLLHRNPMHGYELSKQLNVVLGTFRALSYGTLYPCLNKLYADGLIAKEDDTAAVRPARAVRASARAASRASGRPPGRSKIVYRLTAEGKERLQDLLGESGPAEWEDDEFGVHFAFFGQTRADIRLRILEGRRSRLEDRVEGVRVALARTAERVDSYTLELQRHGLESVEREVRWLNELIDSERRSQTEPPNQTEPRNQAPVRPAQPQTENQIDRGSEKESS